jgi:glycosyltransferase involved in cell wall biosynthesis
MRIIFVSYLHPEIAPGGEQQIAYEMFQEALAQGHDAYLIAALEAHHEGQYGKLAAPIVPFPGRRREYFFFAKDYDHLNLSVGDWRCLEFLKDMFERLRPDVIHFHHYHRIGVEAFRVARLAAPKAFIGLTFHEMMAMCHANGQMVTRHNRKLCRAATPLACSQCFEDIRPEFFILRAERIKALMGELDHFFFPSEFLADRYVAWGLSPEKCTVIPNGLRNLASGFDRGQHSAELNRFGFFGQFLDNKGVDIILEALLILARDRRVPRGGIVCELNAANKHFASAQFVEKVTGQLQRLREFEVAVQIIDRDAYDREAMADRMASIDWVLVPSTWWEIFGLVVSEAWMFGRPVIASRIGGLAERVTAANGLTFPPGDAYALAHLLQTCCGNEGVWTHLNRAAPSGWSISHMMDAYTQVWCDPVTA